MEVNDRMRVIGDIISKLEFSVQSFYKLKRDNDVPKDYLTPELNDLPNLKSQYIALYNRHRVGAVKDRVAGKELDKIEGTLRNIVAAFHYALTANRFFDITGKKLGAKLPQRYKNGHAILKKIEGESKAISSYSTAQLKNPKEFSADALTKKYMIHMWGYFSQIKNMKMYLFKQIEAELKTDIDFVRTHGLTKAMLKHEKHIITYGTKRNVKQVVMFKNFDKLLKILTRLYDERKNSLMPKESLIRKIIGSLEDLDSMVRSLNMPESRIRSAAPQLIKYRNYGTKYTRTLWTITAPKIKQIGKEISAEKKAIFRKDLEEIKKMRANIKFLADIAKRHNLMNQLKVLREANGIDLKPSNYEPKRSLRFRQLYERAVISITNSMNTKVMS